MNKLQAIRGMNDILPSQTCLWQYVEAIFRDILARYGYLEIRTPVLESTALFQRSIGESTDIVEKEMYTFADRNGESVTLRPEFTAGITRALLQHNLVFHQTPRLWSSGPVFRYERPQKGRYRQFHQLSVEVFNLNGPDIDVELLLIAARLFKALGIYPHVQLELNTLGTSSERALYRQQLIQYFNKHRHLLDEDSQRRLIKNPLRILDSKNPAMAAMLNQAPKLIDTLGSESQQYFQKLCHLLELAGLNYVINPRLVRGLDYYSHTVFEWTTTALGSQGTVCGGGRYDELVTQLGGNPMPALGFGIGLERLILLLETLQLIPATINQTVDIYFVCVGKLAQQSALLLTEQLRDRLPHLRLMLHCGQDSFKQQLKKADRSGAPIALILGDDECQHQQIGIKYLHLEQPQITIAQSALTTQLNNFFTKSINLSK